MNVLSHLGCDKVLIILQKSARFPMEAFTKKR